MRTKAQHAVRNVGPPVIYIDQIVISTLTIGSTFDSSVGGFVQSSTLAIPGSTLTWSSAMP